MFPKDTEGRYVPEEIRGKERVTLKDTELIDLQRSGISECSMVCTVMGVNYLIKFLERYPPPEPIVLPRLITLEDVKNATAYEEIDAPVSVEPLSSRALQFCTPEDPYDLSSPLHLNENLSPDFYSIATVIGDLTGNAFTGSVLDTKAYDGINDRRKKGGMPGLTPLEVVMSLVGNGYVCIPRQKDHSVFLTAVYPDLALCGFADPGTHRFDLRNIEEFIRKWHEGGSTARVIRPDREIEITEHGARDLGNTAETDNIPDLTLVIRATPKESRRRKN